MSEKDSRGPYGNARKHGLTLAEPVVRSYGETAEAFAAHRQAFIDNLQPQDAVQAALVDDIASCTWRLGRLRKLEAKYSAPSPEPESPASRLYARTTPDDESLNNVAWPFGNGPAETGAKPWGESRLLQSRFPTRIDQSARLLALIATQEERLRSAWQKSLRILLNLQRDAEVKPTKGERKSKKRAPASNK